MRARLVRGPGWRSAALPVAVLLAWAAAAAAGESSLAYFRQAKINWRQAEGQKLAVVLGKQPYTEGLLPQIGDFEALTGIKVEYVILPEPDYAARLQADLSGQRGELPVILTGPTRNWQYAALGWVQPLDEFLKNPKLTDPAWYRLDDFFPGFLAANRWNGKLGGGVGEGPLYSVPATGETYLLAYRKDLFDQHGIAAPSTLGEMAAAARAVKERAGVDGIVARGAPSAASVAGGFISGAKSFADGRWDEVDASLASRLHDPIHVAYVDQWVSMIRESGPPHWPAITGAEARSLFAAGQAGMIADSDLFAATYEDAKRSRVAGKVGYALIPPGPAGATYSALWTWSLGMSRAAKNKDAAWLFIQWATAGRTLTFAAVEYRAYNPSRASVLGAPPVHKLLGQWGNGSYLDALSRNLQSARLAWVPHPDRVRLGEIWIRALHEVYFKRLSAAEAMQRASAEVDRLAKSFGLKK